ncbi:hypothetical protein SEA_WILKINS_4 [Mycobacterium phage Wilkins]|nr:hypothetical protein SEA_WILKINS_4 [Mycobacterium phage Wilkins]QOI67055.1 hypothetical protein SEA_TOPGUN_4 [Mycobacterium phage Topgun]
MPEPTAVPGGVERSPSGAPPLGLPLRPGRNVPTEAVRRDDGGIGAQEPLQTPPMPKPRLRAGRRPLGGHQVLTRPSMAGVGAFRPKGYKKR